MGNEYYRVIDGRGVWVTLRWPWVYDDSKGVFVRSDRCCSVFAIGNPQKSTESEPVTEDGQVRWFVSGDAAVQEAFAESARRIAEKC